MKKQMLSLLVLSALTLSSCAQSINSRVSSGFITSLEYPDSGNAIDNQVKPLKKGEACVKSILGIYSYGDSSVAQAMKNGNITRVHHVDANAFNVAPFYATGCTIVYGE